MSANRRDFIKFVVAGAVTAGCPIDISLVAAQTDQAQKHSAADVDGEDNRICHQVRDGKVFLRPAASARHDVVIVGGGISGLTAAYRLQHRDFLLLEKEPHFGGNAYAMEYDGSTYGTGTAFLSKEEYAYHFAKEIGLEPLPVNSSDASIIRGELVPDTWGDGLNKLPYPEPVREGFKKFKKEMLAIDLEKRGKELSNTPFSDFMKAYPPELKQWWDAYGPSNYGAESDEASATVGILELQSMAEESDAMHQIRYIPYPVVNLIFDKPVFNHGYDTWCPGSAFTDIVVADWVIQKQPGYKQKFNILSCYTPMKEEQRSLLLTEGGARSIAASVLRDFQKLMPELNVDPIEVHIYRRGHPLYMSTPGLFTEVQPLVRRPMDRIFFANTDSQGPESTANEAILAAQRAVKEVTARLAGRPAPKEKAVAG